MILTKSIREVLDLLRLKKISVRELVESSLNQCQSVEKLNAFITPTFEQALEEADKAQARYSAGTARFLEGLPVAQKDLFCTKGVRTTAGSLILDTFVPPYDAWVVEKWQAAGTISLGKLNMDEFAMGSGNLNSAYGPVYSPYVGRDGKACVPGGSSGGSSALVAAFGCFGATGSDTGGSIRQPAAYTGLVGIKPTYGSVSRYGIISFASSLDQAGVLARSVDDAALLLEAMMGPDPRDSTSFPSQPKPLTQEGRVVPLNRKLRVGIPKEYAPPTLSAEIRALWDRAKTWVVEQGHEIVDISLPHTELALPAYYIIAPAEASSNLSRYDGVRFGLRAEAVHQNLNAMYEATRAGGFGSEVARRILLGTYVLSAGFYDAYYTKAQKVRRLIVQDFQEAFKKIDVILTPTAPSEAFSLEHPPSDPVQMYLNDIFTVPASLAGLPALSLPGGYGKKGLPLGLQLIAPPFEEALLVQVARGLEEAADFQPLSPEQVRENMRILFADAV